MFYASSCTLHNIYHYTPLTTILSLSWIASGLGNSPEQAETMPNVSRL